MTVNPFGLTSHFGNVMKWWWRHTTMIQLRDTESHLDLICFVGFGHRFGDDPYKNTEKVLNTALPKTK